MQNYYSKSILFVVGLLVLASLFTFITVPIFQSNIPRAGVFLRDMSSSYTFKDDVYQLNVSALQDRFENWVNHLYEQTDQPTCLSASFTNFQESNGVNLTECSTGVKLSDLANKPSDTGTVSVKMGEKQIGEIEWFTQSTTDYFLLSSIFAVYLVAFIILSSWYWWLFGTSKDKTQPNDPNNIADLRRSLYRVMKSNRRTMALHDNWVYGTREHPYVEFVNLDGSKLKIRASLLDIEIIFSGTRYINRSTVFNASVGVHSIDGNKVTLNLKSSSVSFDIDSQFLENAKNA
jgi:hypothetical protein